MNNYQTAFTEEQIEKSPVNILGGRFSKDNYLLNITKYSLDTLRAEAKQGDIPLWKMTFKEEDYEEDNDTSEEEESDEEENKDRLFDGIDELKLKQLGRLQNERISELINPKKGFKFFIEQEQKFLEKIEEKQKKHLAELKEKQSQIHNNGVQIPNESEELKEGQ